MFFKFFVEVSHYIIANDKNFKLNMISIFLKDDKLLEKFINYIIVGTYHSINYNTNMHILIETIQRFDIFSRKFLLCLAIRIAINGIL